MVSVSFSLRQTLEESYRRQKAKGNEEAAKALIIQIKAEKDRFASPVKPGERI